MIAALALVLLTAAPPMPGGAVLKEHLPNLLSAAKVGEWVTYRFDDGAGREYFWRIAVVGETLDEKQRPAVWVEIDFGTHPAMKAPIAQMKMLASRAQGLSKEGITRVLAGFGTDRPREVEPGDLPKMLADQNAPAPPRVEPGPKLPPSDIRVKQGDPTRLITLGGTVTASAVEVRVRDTLIKRIWLSDQIPIMKLAKIEFPAIQHAMEVRDWGLDAKPQMVPPEAGAATIRMEGPK